MRGSLFKAKKKGFTIIEVEGASSSLAGIPRSDSTASAADSSNLADPTAPLQPFVTGHISLNHWESLGFSQRICWLLISFSSHGF
ncbi:hypothetical protein ACLB2K_004492 [Fragaria x ananassa]